jgi:5'-3' exoribonuclease 2
MGVPGFVAWLYHNHKNTNFIFKQLLKSSITNNNIKIDSIDHNIDVDLDLDLQRVESVQHLLIDTNCLIHPQARQVCLDNPSLVESNLDLLEKKIIKQVITYIELLIDQTKPTDSVYIAIDGVAPMAKIKHQRLRRFKSVYDRKITESIAKKHGRTLPKEWNTSAITPGTIFMDKLTKSILTWIRSNNFGCKVVFSSSYTPGEGEHKLLQYLKTLNLTDKSTTVIYGLDADLLFLSLASERNNIFLMRETSQMEIDGSHFEEGFSYLSINLLHKIIYDEMISRLSSDRMWDPQRLTNDFVFLCYFCGNDFLPNIPSLSIKPPNKKIPHGIDTIIDAYTEVMNDFNEYKPTQYLINISTNFNQLKKTVKINYDIFMQILDNLSEQETAYYNDFFNFKRYIHRSNKTDPFELDKQNYEENIIGRYHDPIHLGDTSTNLNCWKKKYYKHYFDVNVNPSNPSDNSLNVILDEYVRGLVWTTYYYYDKCKDYEWYYDHHHGPFISDLRNYFKRNPYRMEHFEQIYSGEGVWYYDQIKPLQQLMLVLPHESSYLLPATYRNLMFSLNLQEYFPAKILDIKMDYLYKNKAWQNIPMIPIIHPRIVVKLTSKVILKDESDRNRTYDDYVKNIDVNKTNNALKSS